ncbi:hypothetical protein BDZ94DRAFT_1251654 [Collybia nuda]|uniref:Uncharacterized protein n=1 Tax=Collybia nuda TaxID=64659 RepID=A0A9P5YCG4_9AGAR|nr:hypothetical protein BDZ94DRAFT_1251654 [Collybia nuda]
MGNSTSSSGRGHHDETVDHGHLTPQGVYTGPRDWNQAIVSQLICARRLAPFYRPLEEYDESWDDDQILAARKELPMPDSESQETMTRIEATASSHSSIRSSHSKRQGTLKEPSKSEAAVYRGAVECPICFLYYPPNINHSRCCDQAICTECFVQIKRIEPTTTHLVSEPAACPYCVQDNFGIVYSPPPWRAGIGCDTGSLMWSDTTKGSQQSIDTTSPYPTHKRRQKSFGADSPEVVTTDQIRPDWEAKLAAVRAAVTRRANRRIIMRQVGDRLIPVGVTSGRVHALSPEEAAAEGVDNGGSRRSRRRNQAPNQTLEQFLGMGGQDLEELMLMEAMRLSMIDHEEHQRKEAEAKKQEAAAQLESISAEDAESPSGAGPSTQETPSRNFTDASLTSSLPPPSSPVPVPSQDPSHTKRNSLLASLSRSRTPPLANTLSTSASGSDGTSSSWNRRSPSPAPYSTLNAALSTAATASAVLGSNPGHDISTGASGGAVITSAPTPSISISGSDTSSPHVSNEHPDSSQRSKSLTSVMSADAPAQTSLSLESST